jgi:hypothetical protein
MKARVWCFVVVAPVIAAGCATPNTGAGPGDHDFSQETISPGSAVAQGPGTVVVNVTRPGDQSFSEETIPPGSAVAQGPGAVVVPPPLTAVPPAKGGTPPGAHDFSQETISPGSAVLQGPGTVVSGTAGVAVAGQQGSQQIVEAEALEANEVHAQIIYANHIQSPDIHGTIHQTGGVRMDRSVSDLKAVTVTAGVLYADTIKADRVIADQIYVREIDRR